MTRASRAFPLGRAGLRASGAVPVGRAGLRASGALLALLALAACQGCSSLGETFDQMNDPYGGGVPTSPPEPEEETET